MDKKPEEKMGSAAEEMKDKSAESLRNSAEWGKDTMEQSGSKKDDMREKSDT